MSTPPPKALITGAGSGIGRALALQAARSGHDLVLVGRRLAQLEETAALLGTARPRLVAADITTPEGRAAITDAAGPRLDMLVNNAGRLSVGRLTDLDDTQIAQTIGTNLTAAVQLTRDLVPALCAAQGRIVNIGSMFGMIAFPYFSAYSATKFAMRGLSDALRRELSEFGISVTYVAPRATRTPAQASFAHLVEPFGMVLDDPDRVARRAWAGIMAGRKTIYPGPGERLFALLQAVAPSIIDTALTHKAGTAKAQAALNKYTHRKEA
jgi:short-subunit dehydrogenase